MEIYSVDSFEAAYAAFNRSRQGTRPPKGYTWTQWLNTCKSRLSLQYEEAHQEALALNS